MQVSVQTVGAVVEELVPTDLEPEIDTRQVLLGSTELNLIVQTDNDREAASRIMTSLTHVWAKVRQSSIPSLDTRENLESGNAHDKRPKSLGNRLDTLVPVILTEGPDSTEDANVGVRRLTCHL